MKRAGTFWEVIGTALGVIAILAIASTSVGAGGDWKAKYKVLNFAVISAENEADLVSRYKSVRAYFERTLGVKIKMHRSSDYAGVIEGLKAKKLEFGRLGPASYARAYLVSKGEIIPIVAASNKWEKNPKKVGGYHAVVAVKASSPYRSIEDLKGKKFGFADPNSTSGHQAPRFFLTEQGYDPDKYFGKTAFSGNHEMSVVGVLNGTFDAAATWWRSEERSNVTRMEGKGMIPKGKVRYIWKSPKLPNSPWATRKSLPEGLKETVTKMLLEMPEKAPKAWKDMTDGKEGRLVRVTHKDYEPVVRFVKFNQKRRRGKN